MPRNTSIEQYKADLDYQARIAALKGDYYKADQLRAMHENVARIQASSDRYKVDELTKREREKEKREAGRNDIESIVGFRRAMNMQGSKDFDSMIKALEVVNKMEADRKPTNAEMDIRGRILGEMVINDPKTGKQRKLLPEEKNAMLDKMVRRSGGGSDQLREMIMGRLGPAKGQNILNPNPPQDRSVPPSNTGSVPTGPQGAIQGATVNAIPGQAQQFSNPQQELQAYFRGIPQAQRGEAIAKVKEGGLAEITNPQSTGHKFLLEKIYGLPSSAMDDETHKQFQKYMQGKYTQGYDPQDYIWERDNFQRDNRPPVPWSPMYGSKEWEAQQSPYQQYLNQADLPKTEQSDLEFFRRTLPHDEFVKLQNRMANQMSAGMGRFQNPTEARYSVQQGNFAPYKSEAEARFTGGWTPESTLGAKKKGPQAFMAPQSVPMDDMGRHQRISGSLSNDPYLTDSMGFDQEYGTPSKFAFRSEAPQYSGPTQVAGDPLSALARFLDRIKANADQQGDRLKSDLSEANPFSDDYERRRYVDDTLRNIYMGY